MDNNLRKSILKTAEGLFTKYGIKSIKVDDICNELHISKKTFYTEFENKEALIEAVYDSINDKAPHRFDMMNEIEVCENVIDLWLKRPSMAVREHHKKYEVFMYDLLKYYPSVREIQAKKEYNKVSSVIRALLNKGITQGLFREDMDIEVRSDGYLSEGGQGWRCINSSTGEGEDKTYDTITPIIALEKENYDIKTSKIKCVVIYSESVKLNAEITIYNNNITTYDIVINSSSETKFNFG